MEWKVLTGKSPRYTNPVHEPVPLEHAAYFVGRHTRHTLARSDALLDAAHERVVGSGHHLAFGRHIFQIKFDGFARPQGQLQT
jgi:hypothetical protein